MWCGKCVDTYIACAIFSVECIFVEFQAVLINVFVSVSVSRVLCVFFFCIVSDRAQGVKLAHVSLTSSHQTISF